MANLENYLTISTNFKHTQTLTHSNPIPQFLLKKNKYLCSPKDRDEKALSSLTSNSPKLENTQMSIRGRMDKYIVACSLHVI